MSKKEPPRTPTITKQLANTINDFLTEYGFSLVHDETQAVIRPQHYEKDWAVERQYETEQGFMTRKGAVNSASKTRY